jgi:hypothetical protein
MKHIFCAVTFLLAYQLHAQEPLAAVRICDGRPAKADAPRLAVYLNTLRATGDSRPGSNTSWGKLPAGPYEVSVKDKENHVLANGAVKLEVDNHLSIVLWPDGDKLKILPVAVKQAELQGLQKNSPGAALFVPVNLAGKATYTFQYTSLGENPQPTSMKLAPGEWKIFPVLPTSDWKLQCDQKSVPLSRLPPTSLMTGRVVMLMLPEENAQPADVLVLDGTGGGIISEDK